MSKTDMLIQLIDELHMEVRTLRAEVAALRKEARRSRKASEEVLERYKFDDDEEHEEFKEHVFNGRAEGVAKRMQDIALALMERGMKTYPVTHAVYKAFPHQKVYKKVDSFRRTMDRIYCAVHHIKDTTKVNWIKVDNKVIEQEVAKLL